MTFLRAARPAVAVTLALGLAACAGRGGPGDLPDPAPSPAAEGLVLRVEHTGGFVTPSMLAGRLPLLSVYADGRVITEGPVVAIYPAPALPNLQVAEIEPAAVTELVDRALAAGVDESADLGTPPIADAPTTRFTVVTADDTHVREVYALRETTGGAGLTGEQVAAREELVDLLESLTDTGSPSTTTFEAEAVAAIASPWVDPDDGLVQPEQAWPGPALPGESTGGPPDVTCVTATGAQAQALLQAAATGNAATPWTTGDGARWSVTFRPLLPDETGCADLGR
jgi:hypothetical protein